MTFERAQPWTALLICLLLSIGMTAPAWMADEPSFIGHWDALDLPGSVWAHWWVQHAFSTGQNPFVDTVSFWPVGLDPVLQYNLLDAVVGAPWIALFGVIHGYNVATVVALTATGMGGYALGRSMRLSAAGATFVGVAIQSSSSVALELYEGRLSQFLLVFLLLALAAFVRVAYQPPNRRKGLLLGACAAATALVYWYAGLYFLLSVAALVAFGRIEWTRNRVISMAIGAAVGAALVLPFVMELMGQWDTLPGMTRNTEGSDAATNLASLKSGQDIATENSRWWLWPIVSRANQEAGHQMSIVVMLGTAFAIRHRCTRIAGWLGVAAVGWLLALGPVFHGFSSTGTASAPFGWLQSASPIFARMWWPQRFEVLTAIGLAVVAGAGIDHWMKDRSRPWLGWSLVMLLTVADLPWRSGVVPVRASTAPDVFEPLYRDLDGPLLTTPIRPGVRTLNHQRWLQTQHELPMLNGNGEHIPGHAPQAWLDWMNESAVIAGLDTLQNEQSVAFTVTPEDIDHLIAAGFQYAVTDPSVYGNRTGRNWAATLGSVFTQLWGSPIRRHRGGAVWAIQPITEPITVTAKYLQRGDRIRR